MSPENKKKVGRKPILTFSMKEDFGVYIEENNIDISAMSLSEFTKLTQAFYKDRYQLSLVYVDNIKRQPRRSVRIANLNKKKIM